jgi:hypothetical protein
MNKQASPPYEGRPGRALGDGVSGGGEEGIQGMNLKKGTSELGPGRQKGASLAETGKGCPGKYGSEER